MNRTSVCLAIFLAISVKLLMAQQYWQSTNGPESGIVEALVVDSKGFLFAGTSKGIHVTKDDGNTWEKLPNNLSDVYIRSLAINSQDHLYAGTNDGLFRSMDEGKTWKQLENGLPDSPITALVVNSRDQIILCTGQWQERQGDKLINNWDDKTVFGVYRSFDNGETWTKTDTDMMCLDVLSICVDSLDNLFLGVGCWWGSGIYRSSDDGKNWHWVGTGLPPGPAHALTTNKNNYIYAGFAGASIFNFSTGMFDTYPPRGVYRSTDQGESWQEVNNGLSWPAVYRLTAGHGCVFSAGTDGVFRSSNHGESWERLSFGADWPDFLCFAFKENGLIFGGTWGAGVVRNIFPQVECAVEQNHESKEWFLEQNYPNPFNQETTITLHAPMMTTVTLKLYDIKGREIRNLMREQLPAGKHRINLNASSLPSGVYLYRVRAGDFVDTKKLILAK